MEKLTPWELCLSLDCGIYSVFNNRVGCGWQLEVAIWHFITTAQNFVIGRNDFDWGFGFSNCLNLLGHSAGLRTTIPELPWLGWTWCRAEIHRLCERLSFVSIHILQTVPYICLVFLLKFSPNTTKPRHLYEKWQQHINAMLPIIVNARACWDSSLTSGVWDPLRVTETSFRFLAFLSLLKCI